MGKYFHELDGGDKLKADNAFCGVVEADQRGFRDKISGLIFFLALVGFGVLCCFAGKHSDTQLLNDHSKDNVTHDLAGLKDQKYVLLVGALGTMFLAFLWLELLKRFTKVIVYGSIFGGIGLVFGCGVLLLTMGHDKSGGTGTALQIAGVATMVVAVLLALFIFWIRRRINFTCAVIAQGCRGIQANKSIFTIVTPFILGLSILYLVWWMFTVVYLFSAKGDEVDCLSYDQYDPCVSHLCNWDETGAANCTGTGHNIDKSMRYGMFFAVFMFFWGTLFIIGVARTTISGTIAQWYFARDKDSIECANSTKFLRWSLTYHFGTIAQGSLILAIFKFVNWCLDVAQREADNIFVKIVLCCVQCFFRCLERLVRFVTKFAYVYVAMHGRDFMDSCKSVSQLFSRSGFGKLFLTELLVGMVIQLGMFASVGLVIFCSVLYMNDHGGVTGSNVTILAAFCMFTFWIVGLVVEVAADTVVVCFLEDCERNAESRDFRGEDAYFQINEAVTGHSNNITTDGTVTYGTGK